MGTSTKFKGMGFHLTPEQAQDFKDMKARLGVDGAVLIRAGLKMLADKHELPFADNMPVRGHGLNKSKDMW